MGIPQFSSPIALSKTYLNNLNQKIKPGFTNLWGINVHQGTYIVNPTKEKDKSLIVIF